MGTLIKFFLIAFAVIYLFYRAASFLFRFMLGGFSNDQFDHTQYQRKKARNGNVNVDRVPSKESGKKEGYEGGEYVDFEEVK